MSGRIKALALLALALLRTLWRLAWHRQIDGLAHFRDNYDEDGLTPLTEDDRGQMRNFGRCIACGRCDRGDAERILASRGEYRGTMGLVLAASRSMPDYRAAARGFAHLSEADLEAKERLCPTRVPLRQIARFVHANAAAARVSLPAAQGVTRIPSSFPVRERTGQSPS
jgi:succinate dehydrogenase/fumarate reductase-like Fe-S protein